jgi:hypothetical protein
MDMTRYAAAARSMRRPSTILDTVSLVGLATFFVFWVSVTWVLFAPPTLLSLPALYAAMLSLGMTIALPAMLSALIPNTAAGMMLQRARWRTWGFAVTLGCSVFLLYFAAQVLDAWLLQFPMVAETDTHWSLIIVSLIVGVVIPTLSWVQVAPDRWLAEVLQAHEVQKLELYFDGQIAKIKIQFARQALLLQKGIANLTVKECDELVGFQEAINNAINRTLQDVANLMDVRTGRSTGVNLLPDNETTQLYDNLATGLLQAQIRTRPPAELPSPVDNDVDDPPVAQQYAETHAPANARERNDAGRGGPQRPANEAANASGKVWESWVAAQKTFGSSVWKRADLERALSIQKTKAIDLIRAWRAEGYVIDITDPKDHYQLRFFDEQTKEA